MKKIFVQIASYRDPELVPTIKSCIENCSDPNRLSFGIVRQLSDDDQFNSEYDEYKNRFNFRTIDVDYKESKGCGWARSLTQSLYQDEELTLQIDSHHRFAKDWDLFLDQCMIMTKSEKPILTSYCAGYSRSDTKQNYEIDNRLLKMVPTKIYKKTGNIPYVGYYAHSDVPLKSRFVSGHFFYTLGKHCKEYHYDPEVYFTGEEISLAVRSYTLGYDLFHPHKNVVWHDYNSYSRSKHWSDHKKWYEADAKSTKRWNHLLQMNDYNIDLGKYGLGNVRSLHDYEEYAGISFKDRKIHPNVLNGDLPPMVYKEQDWKKNLHQYTIDIKQLKDNSTYSHFYVCFDNDKNIGIKNFIVEEKDVLDNDSWFSFYSEETPVRIVVFGINYDKSKNIVWGKSIVENI